MHKTKAGKLQTGNTFPKQYWLAVNGKPKKSNPSISGRISVWWQRFSLLKREITALEIAEM